MKSELSGKKIVVSRSFLKRCPSFDSIAKALQAIAVNPISVVFAGEASIEIGLFSLSAFKKLLRHRFIKIDGCFLELSPCFQSSLVSSLTSRRSDNLSVAEVVSEASRVSEADLGKREVTAHFKPRLCFISNDDAPIAAVHGFFIGSITCGGDFGPGFGNVVSADVLNSGDLTTPPLNYVPEGVVEPVVGGIGGLQIFSKRRRRRVHRSRLGRKAPPISGFKTSAQSVLRKQSPPELDLANSFSVLEHLLEPSTSSVSVQQTHVDNGMSMALPGFFCVVREDSGRMHFCHKRLRLFKRHYSVLGQLVWCVQMILLLACVRSLGLIGAHRLLVIEASFWMLRLPERSLFLGAGFA